jgi:hypothetical protein
MQSFSSIIVFANHGLSKEETLRMYWQDPQVYLLELHALDHMLMPQARNVISLLHRHTWRRSADRPERPDPIPPAPYPEDSPIVCNKPESLHYPYEDIACIGKNPFTLPYFSR